MSRVLQNLRYAVRVLLKTPDVTAVAVVSLGLGIGANTAMFSFIYELLLRPLPVEDPQRLVAVFSRHGGGSEYGTSSFPDYQDFRDQSGVFTGLAAQAMLPVSLSGDASADVVLGKIVTANYFSVLGVKAARGRTFLPEEGYPSGSVDVCVISDALWKRRFGSDPSVVGRKVVVNGSTTTVVGIAPEGFHGTTVAVSTEIWTPMSMVSRMTPFAVNMEGRGNEWLEIVGRLKPGVTLEQASGRMLALSERLAEEHPNSNRNKRSQMVPFNDNRIPLVTGVAEAAQGFLMMLLGVVGLVLLIACFNVAGVLLARAVGRRGEIALRLAVGAGRREIIGQLLVESLLLALLGGLAGLFVALWSIDALLALAPPTLLPLTLQPGLDLPVLIFTTGVAVGAALLFGLLPALQSTKFDLVPALKDPGARMAGKGVRSRLRNGLVGAQVALCVVLLVGTGLFLKSLRNAGNIDYGFNPRNLLVVGISVGIQGYDEAQGRQFYQALLERIRGLPGVESAALGAQLPLGMTSRSRSISVPGYVPAPEEFMSFGYNGVSPGFFETAGIPILSGRGFLATDTAESEPVVIINEAMAQRFWPGEDPVGRALLMRNRPHRIVAVAKTGKYRTLGEEPTPYYYLPIEQHYEPLVYVHVRTANNPGAFAAPLLKEIRNLDPHLPAFYMKTMTDHLGYALFPTTLASSAFTVFGSLALLLAVVGIYGVISYWVNQRTREIGIRTALGAARGDVVKMVLGRGLMLVFGGILCGLVFAAALSRLLGQFLHDVNPLDAETFIGASLVLVTVALAACFFPARRAARVDPMTALRYE